LKAQKTNTTEKIFYSSWTKGGRKLGGSETLDNKKKGLLTRGGNGPRQEPNKTPKKNKGMAKKSMVWKFTKTPNWCSGQK